MENVVKILSIVTSEGKHLVERGNITHIKNVLSEIKNTRTTSEFENLTIYIESNNKKFLSYLLKQALLNSNFQIQCDGGIPDDLKLWFEMQ